MPHLMTPAQRDRQVDALLEAAKTLRSMPVVTPCSACTHFDAQTSHCRHWKQAVPAEAQAEGCAQWDEAVPY